MSLDAIVLGGYGAATLIVDVEADKEFAVEPWGVGSDFLLDLRQLFENGFFQIIPDVNVSHLFGAGNCENKHFDDIGIA